MSNEEVAGLVEGARAMVALGNFAMDVGAPHYRQMITDLAAALERYARRPGEVSVEEVKHLILSIAQPTGPGNWGRAAKCARAILALFGDGK